MIDKLLWYDYDKPCLYSFKGEGKEHKGGQKRKVREEKKRKKKQKDITSPGSSIDLASGGEGGPGPGGCCIYSDFSQFSLVVSPLPLAEFLASHAN